MWCFPLGSPTSLGRRVLAEKSRKCDWKISLNIFWFGSTNLDGVRHLQFGGVKLHGVVEWRHADDGNEHSEVADGGAHDGRKEGARSELFHGVRDRERSNEKECAEEEDVRNTVSDAEDVAAVADERPVVLSAVHLAQAVSTDPHTLLKRDTVLVNLNNSTRL